jgi:hypothetical protein
MKQHVISQKHAHHIQNLYVATVALGSQLKQGLAKVRAKNEAWESHFMLPKV